MFQKTKKVCIGTLQAHAKSQHNWIKFEILSYASKNILQIFFWGHPLGSKDLEYQLSL